MREPWPLFERWVTSPDGSPLSPLEAMVRKDMDAQSKKDGVGMIWFNPEGLLTILALSQRHGSVALVHPSNPITELSLGISCIRETIASEGKQTSSVGNPTQQGLVPASGEPKAPDGATPRRHHTGATHLQTGMIPRFW